MYIVDSALSSEPPLQVSSLSSKTAGRDSIAERIRAHAKNLEWCRIKVQDGAIRAASGKAASRKERGRTHSKPLTHRGSRLRCWDRSIPDFPRALLYLKKHNDCSLSKFLSELCSYHVPSCKRPFSLLTPLIATEDWTSSMLCFIVPFS